MATTNGINYNQTRGLLLSTNGKNRIIVSTGGTTTFTGDTNGSTVLSVSGTNGNLLSVVDTNTGTLLEVLDNSNNFIFQVGTVDKIKISGLTQSTDPNVLTIDSSGIVHTYPISSIGFTGGTVTGATNFTGGVTANTISATTYQNIPSQSGTGISAFAYNSSTGLLTITKNDTTTLTAGTFSYITATTLSAANVLSVASNGGSPTTTTINAVTGGTYSSGTITLSGTGNFQSTITGLDALTPTTFYSGDGSLSGNRVINISSNTLNFSSSTLPGTVLFLSSGTVNIGTSTPDGTKFYVNSSISAAKFVSTQSTALSVIGGANGNPIATFSTTSGTVEKVRVSSGGFLGVGTTSPSNALHVSATTNPVRFVGLQSASDTSLLTVDGTGVVHTVSTSSIGGLTWNNATATQSATANNGYVGTATTLTTITLPSTAAFGSVIEVVGTGTGLWQISQNANQFINFGIVGTTTGTTGYLSATSQYDCVKLLCTSANTAFVVTSAIGNIFYN